MSLSISSKTPVRMPVSPLQVLLMIQLDGSPKYGYEMLKTLKDEFDGVWEPKTGTVYPALKSLAKKGFVETEERDGTEYYHITEKGRKLFPELEKHFADSLGFTVNYLAVLFKWMSKEMKQGALRIMSIIVDKDEDMTHRMLTQFHSNLDADVKKSFLNKVREMTEHRLELVDKLLEETQ
ncbi:helix-turn-helix transcriptional regulator [Candidatus Bathyarchaeota archaeon]|nr:helix-turn-helix transcriptional regulator [Candidatus Bathyarchaeota archaeon]